MTSSESWHNWNLTNYSRHLLNSSKSSLPGGLQIFQISFMLKSSWKARTTVLVQISLKGCDAEGFCCFSTAVLHGGRGMHLKCFMASFSCCRLSFLPWPLLPWELVLVHYKSETKSPCEMWDPIPGETNLEHLKANFPLCLVIDADRLMSKLLKMRYFN